MRHAGGTAGGAQVLPRLISMPREDSRPHVLMSWFMDDWGRFGRAYEQIATHLAQSEEIARVLCLLPADWTLVALGRLERVDRMIKAGNYEVPGGTTLGGLLAKLTQGDVTQTSITIVEGWTVRDLKQALRADGDVAKAAVDQCNG